MRRFGLLLVVLWLGLAGVAGGAEKLPRFSAPVVDAVDVIPAEVELRVDDALLAYQERSGNQIAVAVIGSTGSASLEDYTIDLARAWEVGTKGKDNGVLLLIAVEDRKLRIEVGRGLEGTLTDVETSRIIREQLVPLLRKDDYGGAVEVGEEAIRRALGDTTVGAAPAPVAPAPQDEPSSGSPWPILAFGTLGVIALLAGGLGRRHRGRLGYGAPILWGGGWGSGGAGGSGFGGGGFGGGGGGGFSGGGGGGFGGGGASGGW